MIEHEGLLKMQSEMARQCSEALASLDSAAPAARLAAASARASGQVLLLGMGGSHHVNAIAEPLYRDAGLDCRAWVASELLLSPLPDVARTVLIVSQSGRSGEIVEYVGRAAGLEQRFALTMDGESPLAGACSAALVAEGGPELAFAATRSIILTLALHGAVLEALGVTQEGLRAVLAAPPGADVAVAADAALDGCDAVVFAGYHAMRGVAQSAALSMMELARVPTIGFEGGQFRHGPFEMLRPGLGIVLPRSAGVDAPLVAGLAAASVEAGCRVVVLDTSGLPPLPGCVTVALAPGDGLGAAACMLLAGQFLNIAVARRRIAKDIGSPLRTSKVTV